MAKKVKVDLDLCIACGTCYSTYSDVFDTDDEGKAVLKDDAQYTDDQVDEMVECCAVEAIIAEEE